MTREELTTVAGHEFHALMHLYNLCMQRTLSKYGLYQGQPQVLFAINSLKNPTQNELAAKLGVSKASASISLKRLETAGFLKRVRDVKDGRCVRIELTDKGKSYTRWCEIDFEMMFTTLFEDFSGDERSDAFDTIARMKKSMTQYKSRLDI